jgi:hypothetical protein
MRTQYCREHIKKTAEECGLGPDIVSEVERVAKFCASNPTFADCATRPLRLLIDVRDEKIKNHAISLAENALKEKTPTGGRKKKLLTETDVRGIIRKSEKEIRGELTEKYKAEKKPTEPAPEIPKEPQTDHVADASKTIEPAPEETPPQPSLAAQMAGAVPPEPPIHRPPPCLGGSGCTHKMFEPTYRTCGYNGGARHIAAIKICPFDEEQSAGTPELTKPYVLPCKGGGGCPHGKFKPRVSKDAIKGDVCDAIGAEIAQLPGNMCPYDVKLPRKSENGFVPASQLAAANKDPGIHEGKPAIPDRTLTITFNPENWSYLQTLKSKGIADDLPGAVNACVEECRERGGV